MQKKKPIHEKYSRNKNGFIFEIKLYPNWAPKSLKNIKNLRN